MSDLFDQQVENNRIQTTTQRSRLSEKLLWLNFIWDVIFFMIRNYNFNEISLGAKTIIHFDFLKNPINLVFIFYNPPPPSRDEKGMALFLNNFGAPSPKGVLR